MLIPDKKTGQSIRIFLLQRILKEFGFFTQFMLVAVVMFHPIEKPNIEM